MHKIVRALVGFFVFFVVFIFGLLLNPGDAVAAIFGVDDRLEAGPSNPWFQQSRATAVALLSGNLETQSDGRHKILVDSHKGQLCPSERFSEDPALAYACTGFLVAPDLLVTAGHCATNVGETVNEEKMYCEAYSWLFDYRKDSSGRVQTENIPQDNLYRCKKIIYAVQEEKAPHRDFALIQLDRPVTGGRIPFKLATEIKDSDRLTMIGHPLGMPAKVSRNGRILLDDPDKMSIVTTLDAFAGNSGSPVFNARNEIVGILVGGSPSANTADPIADQQTCSVYNRCDENGENCKFPDSPDVISKLPSFQIVGSDVQRISPLIDLINRHKNQKNP